MKGKRSLIVILLTFLMVLSQMSVATFAAKGWEVTFDLNGAPGTAPETQHVAPDGTATKPEKDPEWERHAFEGWYKGDELFDFLNTPIKENTELVAHWSHPWAFAYVEENNDEGYIYCTDVKCSYNNGFPIRIEAGDVLHVGDPEKHFRLIDPSDDPEFPGDRFEIGDILFYEGTITKVEDFEGKEPIDASIDDEPEGFYTARVIITDSVKGDYSLFKPFQLVSAGPVAAEGLVYKDGRPVIADDDMLPEGTSAVVRYKHPATGKYLSREELVNDGSIPAGETSIDYLVLPSADYDDPEKDQIGRGTVIVKIAAASDTSTGKKGKGVNTGDTNDIAGLLTMMIVSLGALGAMGYKRGKEDQR